ncbi:MAG: hypothetical protein WD063_03245 [Pirellulales bacterium]
MRPGRFCVLVWWLFAAACLWPWEVRAQITAIDDFLGRSRPAETAAKPAGEQPTQQAAELQAKRAAIAERLSVALRTLESTDNPAPADGQSGEVERLKRLGGLYAQQQAAATRGAELEAKKQQAHERLARLREKGVGEPPYSFFLLDELRDELETLTGRAESAKAATGGATDSLRDAKAAVDEAHRKRRQAAESQPASKQPEVNAARPSLKLLEQDAQIANEQFKLRQTELAIERLNKLVIELSIALVKEKIERVAPQVTLSDEEQQEKLVELDKEEAEIIVPNSSFLERNVVNWTLSDKRVRCTISVGLAYGSPTREVARWLKKAALEHGQVLERPEPFVWFVNFGDNALEFELHYWIQIRAMSERRRIESDLRFIIDQYFREAGLVIAFPQRDLHLSNLEPLKVALLPADEARAEQQAFEAA